MSNVIELLPVETNKANLLPFVGYTAGPCDVKPAAPQVRGDDRLDFAVMDASGYIIGEFFGRVETMEFRPARENAALAAAAFHPLSGLVAQTARAEAAEARAEKAERERDALLTWREGDASLPEDEEIMAAHPCATGRHDLMSDAYRLVGAKYSKSAVCLLVNWLLSRLARAETVTEDLRRERDEAEAERTRQEAMFHLLWDELSDWQSYIRLEKRDDFDKFRRTLSAYRFGPPSVREGDYLEVGTERWEINRDGERMGQIAFRTPRTEADRFVFRVGADELIAAGIKVVSASTSVPSELVGEADHG